MQLLIVFCLVLVGAVGTVLMKIGAERVAYGQGTPALLDSLYSNIPLIGGIALHLIPLVGWTILLKTMPLSKLQPMIALTYVVTPLLAVVFLGETVPIVRGVGIGLIVLGVVLVSLG